MNVPKKFDEHKRDLPYPHVAISSVKVGKIEARSILVGVQLDSYIKQNINIFLSYSLPGQLLYCPIIGVYQLIFSCKIRDIMTNCSARTLVNNF